MKTKIAPGTTKNILKDLANDKISKNFKKNKSYQINMDVFN